jgi:hypothetical protein
MQSNTQTNLDLWNATVRYGFHLKHKILERFQSEVLRMIVDATWNVLNAIIRMDLQTPTVKEEIRHYRSHYSSRLSVHPNDELVNLMAQPDIGRCEDACQMICLSDSKCSSLSCSLVFKV